MTCTTLVAPLPAGVGVRGSNSALAAVPQSFFLLIQTRDAFEAPRDVRREQPLEKLVGEPPQWHPSPRRLTL